MILFTQQSNMTKYTTCTIIVMILIIGTSLAERDYSSGVTFFGKTADKIVELLSDSCACKEKTTIKKPTEDTKIFTTEETTTEKPKTFTTEETITCSVKRPNDCSDLDKSTCKSGIYKIYPENTSGFNVFCEMEKHGGGWTVFQHRKNGKLDFYLNWESYKSGFGKLDGECWLGDSFTYHNGQKFSTKDKDHSRNCALRSKGAWWFYSCHFSNLNGLYLKGNHKSLERIPLLSEDNNNDDPKSIDRKHMDQ